MSGVFEMKGIQICSNLEWESVVNLFAPAKFEISPYGQFFFHQFSFWKGKTLIYFSGYSKEKAAGAVQYMISRFGLEQVIVAGSCGGVASELEVLDVIIASETLIYDCIDRLVYETELFPSDFKTQLSIEWLTGKECPPKTHIGRIATADQDIDYSVRAILRPENILVADWESGAIALICSMNQVPLIIFRGVSDLPIEGLGADEQSQQYLTNTPLLMKRIFEQYLPLVEG